MAIRRRGPKASRRTCALRVALALATALAIAACVNVERTLPDGRVEKVSRAELPSYAEAVFKHRNAVSTEYLVRTPEIADSDPVVTDELDVAESRMDAACAPVDALAIAYRDGREVRLRSKLQLAHALEPCATATSAAEQTLKDALGVQ